MSGQLSGRRVVSFGRRCVRWRRDEARLWSRYVGGGQGGVQGRRAGCSVPGRVGRKGGQEQTG